MIFLKQKHYLENIWRSIVHLNSIYNSPSNILRIYVSFESYFQKYDRSRQHWSSKSQGMNGLNYIQLLKKNSKKVWHQLPQTINISWFRMRVTVKLTLRMAHTRREQEKFSMVAKATLVVGWKANRWSHLVSMSWTKQVTDKGLNEHDGKLSQEASKLISIMN